MGYPGSLPLLLKREIPQNPVLISGGEQGENDGK